MTKYYSYVRIIYSQCADECPLQLSPNRDQKEREMKKQHFLAMAVLVTAVAFFCGCPEQPIIDTEPSETVTGKIVIDFDLFPSDETKSLGSAGLSHLDWLMAQKINRVVVWLNDVTFIDCQQTDIGKFHSEVDGLPTGNYKIGFNANNLYEDGTGLGTLFYARQTITIEPGNNVFEITPTRCQQYGFRIELQNVPGDFSGAHVPYAVLDDNSNEIEAGYITNGMYSQKIYIADDGSIAKAEIYGYMTPDQVIDKIILTDDNSVVTEINVRLSVIDIIMSPEDDGLLVVDYSQIIHLDVSFDFGLKMQPTLEITNNNDGSVTMLFSGNDFQFGYDGIWHPIDEQLDDLGCDEPMANFIEPDQLFGYAAGYSIHMDQPLVIPSNYPPIDNFRIEWADYCGLFYHTPYSPYDILVTLDGVPIQADARGYWHI